MEGQVYNSKKGMRALIEGMIFVVAILVLFLVLFNTSLRQTAQKDVDRFLLEISDHTSYIVRTKFDDMYDELNDVGEIYRLTPEETKEQILLSQASTLGARWLGVSDKDGNVTVQGEVYPMGREIFTRQALQGENALSSSLEDPTRGIRLCIWRCPFITTAVKDVRWWLAIASGFYEMSLAGLALMVKAIQKLSMRMVHLC